MGCGNYGIKITESGGAPLQLSLVLKEALGYYVYIDFLVGSDHIEREDGYLVGLGIDYVVLYEPKTNVYVTGNLYSVKFVYFTEQFDHSKVISWDILTHKDKKQ